MILIAILLTLQFQFFSFDFPTNSLSFSNQNIPNFYEIYFSEGRKNVIYSKTLKGNAPQVFVFSVLIACR